MYCRNNGVIYQAKDGMISRRSINKGGKDEKYFR